MDVAIVDQDFRRTGAVDASAGILIARSSLTDGQFLQSDVVRVLDREDRARVISRDDDICYAPLALDSEVFITGVEL